MASPDFLKLAGNFVLCFLFSSISDVAQPVKAHVAVFDEYWTQRQAHALRQTLRFYDPNPFNVTDHFNHHVNLAVEEATEASNGTRRELWQVGSGGKHLKRRNTGKCVAYNPIDRCWRCQPNWAKDRKKLADCVLGFGRRTTGGKAGRYYVVTDASDTDLINPRPGTLRHAVTRDEPLWIVFERSMVIRLAQELIITSNKTIDGRGVRVHITGGAGLTVQFVNNVIIHNIYIKDIVPGNGGLIRDSETHFGLRTRSDGDGINIFGATNVWIDHVSMAHCSDGMIDAIQGSTGITISNCHLTDHGEVMLFGATDKDEIDTKMQITVAFNHFGKRLVQRMPRCRYGLIHVVNNDYTHWEMYAIGGNMNPTIISQGNRFIAPPNEQAKQVTKREYTPYPEWKSWNWQSEGDYFLNGAYFVQSGRANAWSVAPKNPVPSKFAIRPQPGTLVRKLTMNSGVLGCKKGKPC
ncbi:PREDICTED: probable pectate lyase 3 [Tarenaya hassleriana]|uniref:probable pectate lyase 3 n=1 Tax=Tarenaya hassleriana TaxID=28532 RepID=UPI00053C6813|nr:PREDICTED: probable pectate lyase 3 [Tarenaya hassleriana]